MEADEEQQMKAGDSRGSGCGGQPMATVAVVGGGLVGCLQACFLARRGDVRVLLFERRPDIRRMEHVPGRSINMALSCRGRAALAAVGLESAVVAEAIPMHSRMIHDLDGRRRPIRYGTSDDQYLLSIDRRRLNEILLTAAESLAGVTVLFEHRLVKVDLDAGELHFLAGGGRPSEGEQDGSADGERPLAYRVDAIFACDGAYSLVRQEMQAKTRLNFSQEYISHGYVEVPMPAKVSESGGEREYAMEANYLHIWARDEFMMIGLPNADRSFTGTLFMPFDMFGQLRNDDDVTCFFRRHFPDSLPIIGEENLVRAFHSGRALPLVSVRCEPFHHGGRAVLLGDAAHAMVPFYGQGMNAGFEDCLILDELLTMHGSSSSGGSPDFAAAFSAFSEQRCIDAHAMCDLAMANYVEMRAHVNSWSFVARKKVDNVLHWLLADAWLPLYTSVSFTRTRYHQCVANRAWQDRTISRAFNVGGALAMAAAAAALWHSGAFRGDRCAAVLAVCARGVKDALGMRLAIGQSI